MYLCTAEVAERLQRSPWWIRELARRGVLRARRLGPRGELMFDPKDIEAALQPVGVDAASDTAVSPEDGDQ